MDDARPKMCFSPSPTPPIPKAIFSSNLIFGHNCISDPFNAHNTSSYHYQNYKNNNNNIVFNKEEEYNMQRPEDITNVNDAKKDEETTSDYKQWLHAMKLVARLPGGIPPEFRRKLWLSLADKYLKSKNIDWAKEEEKCFCEKWREDDEELGIQIVKDLHRTGSTLCTGPAGDLNQAKLKRILLGYARYNPEVGYCQGFNMLGALILQVMDKDESESIKVMIYLVEGILPTGYFCGSMVGLQADMAVFRELMQTKLPRLAKHLQKLQGPVENAYEPPLTNVFTMQWFLTMFCTCLPMSCVLRVWDLVLIEGSDVLLRTALALWSLLEEKVLSARSADDFYGKMGSFSSELLNGHLIDSNGLIEKVVQLGPIVDIQKLRNKHLYNVTPVERQQGLQLYFDEDEPDIDEDSRLAVATVWGIPWGRRGSQGPPNNKVMENKDRIALDISLLKKQYDKLRERQKQAQIIITTACSTASRQSAATAPLPVNQLLSGRPAIITNKGLRSRPPTGAIPPARKPSLPAVLHEKSFDMQLRRGETLHWRDMKDSRNRRDSLSWKEIKAERAAVITSGSIDGLKSQKLRSGRVGKSDSSSYSEESDDNDVEAEATEDGSSTDTSLCDEDLQSMTNDKKHKPHGNENYIKHASKVKKTSVKQRNQSANIKDVREKIRPKSWAPSNTEIPFVLMTTESPNNSADEHTELVNSKTIEKTLLENDKSPTNHKSQIEQFKWKGKFEATINDEDIQFLDKKNSLKGTNGNDENTKSFDISNEGVTNEYFERVNNTERPTKLALLYSLNEDENVREVFKMENDKYVKSNEEPQLDENDKHGIANVNNSNNVRCMDLLVDYSEKSSAACIEEAKTEISTFQSIDPSASIPLKKEYIGFASDNLLKKTKSISEKRRDPRRLTITRSSTMDIERRFEVFEKRLSMDVYSNYNKFADEIKLKTDDNKIFNQGSYNDEISELINNTNIGEISANKKIPSTADLEQRFENIQQQLVRDRNKIIESPCDSESTEKQPNRNSSSVNITRRNTQIDKTNEAPRKRDENEDNDKIDGEKTINVNSDNPTKKSSAAAEVENVDEINSLKNTQRAIFDEAKGATAEAEEIQNKKEPPDERRDEENILRKHNKNETKEDIGSDADTNNVEKLTDDSYKKVRKLSSTEKENLERNNEMHTDSKRTSNRASPPSTEELEKRFSALEEQISSANTESNESGNKTDEQEVKTSRETLSKTEEDIGQTKAEMSNNVVSSDLKTSLSKFEKTYDNNTKRRLSEPPSTEDLEKRYEVLKRRMSSRHFEIRTLHNDRSSKELPQPNTNKVNERSSSESKFSPPSIENLEERYKKLQNKSESHQSKRAISMQSPPSTANLEERFEKLQNKHESINTQSLTSTEELEETIDKLHGENDLNETKKLNNDVTNTENENKSSNKNEKENENETSKTIIESEKNNAMENRRNSGNKEDLIDPIASASTGKSENDDEIQKSKNNEMNVPEQKKRENVLAKNANKIKIKLIEELQAKMKEHSINTDVNESVEKKTALIKELETKIGSGYDKLLKPTKVVSRRQPTASQSTLFPSLSLNDETLESHATSAHCKSEKYEPLNSTKRNMVRRFSDLPSRADLENRLQFLEEQLSKTLCMQRRSSDSEVASQARLKHKPSQSTIPPSNPLHYRVQELEKHLSDKKAFSMDVECSNIHEKNNPNIAISQVELATDTAAVTGKELVRYSSHGEVGDIEHQNPINISINIQMTLNKDDVVSKKTTDVSKTDDFDRRLQLLEEQLKTSRAHGDLENVTSKSKEEVNKTNLNEIQNTDMIKQNNDQTENKTEIKNLNKTSQESSQVDDQQNAEELLDSTVVGQGSCKNAQNDNSTEESKQDSKEYITTSKCLDEMDNAGQHIQTEDIKSIESTKPDTQDTSSQKQTVFVEENTNKENHKIIDQIEVQAPETKQSNLKKEDCLSNSIQEKTEIPEDKSINQDHVQLEVNDEHLKPTKSIELDEKQNTTKSDNCETKTHSKLERLIDSNNCSQIVPVEVNKKTLVLLLDNEPKAVKVRRLTRANTEELEDLFQALEKQLNDRGHQKVCEKVTTSTSREIHQSNTETTQAMSHLAKEIEEFSKIDSEKIQKTNEKPTQAKKKTKEEEFDWGSDPIKHHLKKKTVYLPSTKELEARFRSLERQIKLLEDVEKIDVEQRLIEIERKIKLQYSLSHEKDLNKFLELCEGKDPDSFVEILENHPDRHENCTEIKHDRKCSTKHTSSNRLKDPKMPINNNPDNRYRYPELKRTKSKQNLKIEPIHPLEMLLDPSPDEIDIPTTGELEHRIRLLEENQYTPSPPLRKSRSVSPPSKQHVTKPNTHILEALTASPTERELPTAEELEARLEALEREQCFNFKMQKNFQEFNQKLKDVVSPSLSFDEFKSSTKISSSGHSKTQTPSTTKPTIKTPNTTSPKTIRFCEKEQSLTRKEPEAKTIMIEEKGPQQAAIVHEGLGVMGIRLMRETSPLRRKGTHTGIPLRTGENINDQLTSIQNTIKSIDTLCEEKPYRKEKCQQYIDSLFSDSTYFAQKKTSFEDLASRNPSRSTSREIGLSIRVSDHSPAFSRSMGSADSIKSSSPLRSSSPLQYRSNRDLRREPSPRRRRDEDREEHESRVRRDNLLPNINYSHSILSHTSHSSLTKFHKVDSQLIPNGVEHEHEHEHEHEQKYEYEESLRQPTFSTIDNLIYHDNTNTSNDVKTTTQSNLNAEVATPDLLKSQNFLDRPILPLCQNIPSNSNTPVYTPAKLEIRHTTVTSTFYDRVLTEKQLEKQHLNSSLTNNQSPMISPLFEKPKINLPPTNNQLTNKTFTYRYDKYVDSN